MLITACPTNFLLLLLLLLFFFFFRQHRFDGEYASVYGRPSTFSNGARNLVLQHAVPLSNPNQITTHLLSVIFAHLRCTRGVPPAVPEVFLAWA